MKLEKIGKMIRNEKNNCKFWVTIFIGPILAGLSVAYIWHGINVIKDYKIHLYLPYAYEYEYMEATHDDPDRKVLPTLPVEVKLDEKNRGMLRLGISNTNIRTLKKVMLHIRFSKDIKVIDYEGWTVWDPNKIYFTLVPDINNGQGISLMPVTLEFSEAKIYKIGYTITGEDIKYIQRNFLVKAVK